MPEDYKKPLVEYNKRNLKVLKNAAKSLERAIDYIEERDGIHESILESLYNSMELLEEHTEYVEDIVNELK